MPLKSVFIDAGNTLLYEMPSRAAIYAEAAREAGFCVTDEEMAASMHRAHEALPRVVGGAYRYSDAWFEAFIARIFGEELGLARDAVAGIAGTLFARFSDPRSFRLFPGATELFDGLRALGLRVGVISNWSPRLPALIEGLGLGPRVDFVLASAAERCEKPDASIFQRALARAKVGPREALHAGDHLLKDVEGARGAGIEAVLVDHGRRAADAPVPRVESLGGLLAFVRERAA